MNEIRHPVAEASADLAMSPLFTATEFDRMNECGAFEDLWVELVEGVIEKMVPPDLGHGARLATVLAKLSSILTDGSLIVAVDVGVRIDELTVRTIDVLVVNSDAPERGSVPSGHVFLAVEISESMQARDLGAKVRDYARGGIPHYWVVDNRSRTVHVFAAPEGEEYAESSTVRFGEPLAVPGTDQVIVID